MRKRKFRNKVKKLIAVAMGFMAIMAEVLQAFHRPSVIYTLAFFFGMGYVMLFLQANGGRHER